MNLIKELVRKRLLSHLLLEADPQIHFKERVKERIGGIKSIEIPSNAYLPNIPKEVQDAWIIGQIKKAVLSKVDLVIAKTYPSKGGVRQGICVLVPLGFITVRPLAGNPVKVKINTDDGNTGTSYNAIIYDNRLTTFALVDPTHPTSRTPQTKLIAHMKNNEKGGWPVNEKESYVDKSFMSPIIIDIKNQSI